MLQLEPEQYSAVRPLFATLEKNLVVSSILEGVTLGKVYADDRTNPRFALLWTLIDAVLLAGQPREELFPPLYHLIMEEMLPDARSRFVPHFTFTIGNQSWANHLAQLFPEKSLVEIPRIAFNLEQEGVDWRELLPSDMRLAPMELSLFARRGLANMDRVSGWVHSFGPLSRPAWLRSCSPVP